jgi:hypothetical protein
MKHLIERLERWHDSGAVWHVVSRAEDEVTVALLRCDGGEEVDRITSRDPGWLAYLQDRDQSPD